ncbi:MAG: HAMP domain-containing protein [Rhodopseudomonas palustris]|nr:HAMP domain-containing protein [Rhodopseudomonas palustris]
MLALNEAVEAVRKGDFMVRAEANGTDELGELGRNFNMMTQELQESFRQIEQKEAKYRGIFVKTHPRGFIDPPWTGGF